MSKDEIQMRLARQSFVPFVVRLADGVELDVPSGDHAHLHPNGRTLFVHLDGGGTEIIDVRLITALRLKEVA